MPNPTPWWGWCPQAGMTRTTTLAVDSNAFGDGYIHRATRGLNPARPAWQVVVPFVGADELQAMETFLVANAACGFWMQPPDQASPVFVVCDTWQAQLVDKSNSDGIVGTMQATFTRSFNPQPVTPT
jgi:phage-related protein